MPEFLQGIFTLAAHPITGDTVPINRFEGITSDSRVVVRDGRGTLRTEMLEASEKSYAADGLAIYKRVGRMSKA